MPSDAEIMAAVLAKYARKLMGDVTESVITMAGDAHPLLKSIATDLLGRAFDDATLVRLESTLIELLKELLGDDFEVIINAQRVDIIDNRD
jgi:hypothetical protein